MQTEDSLEEPAAAPHHHHLDQLSSLKLSAVEAAGADYEDVDMEDAYSIVSQQNHQTDLRVEDLVRLVHELEEKSFGRTLYDAAVGIAFTKKYPALKKGIYAEIKQASLLSGKLFASVKPNPPHPSAHLISTRRPLPRPLPSV